MRASWALRTSANKPRQAATADSASPGMPVDPAATPLADKPAAGALLIVDMISDWSVRGDSNLHHGSSCITLKSAAFRLAPPTRTPPTSGNARIARALDGLTDPP